MPAFPHDRRLGLTWAFLSAVGGALFVIPWKIANTAGDPADSVLLLLSVAALANSGLVAWQALKSGGLPFRIQPIDWGVAVSLASFTLLGNLASARAIQDLSPALLNVLLRAEVILVAIFAWLLLGERVEGRFWIGVVLAAIGLVVLQGPAPGIDQSFALGAGTGMALAAAACFSTLAVVTRRFIHRIDPVVVNALRLWLAVALWFPFNDLPRVSEMPSSQIGCAALAAIAGPFFGRLCLMISARYVPARVTTLASLTAPAMTLVLAFVLLSDWPEPHELLGGAIMVAGISVPLLRPRSEPG